MGAGLHRSSSWSLVLTAAAWLWMAAACFGMGEPRVTGAPLWVRAAASGQWDMVSEGMPLATTTWVRTGALAAGWRYPDGAEVQLAPASLARLIPEASEALVDLQAGTLWWRGGSRARDITIASGTAWVDAGAGDELLVEAGPGGEVGVGVLQGGARVTDAVDGRTPVTLLEQQRTVVRPAWPPAPPAGYDVAADRFAYFPATGTPVLGLTLDHLIRGLSTLGPHPSPGVRATRSAPFAPVIALTFDDGPIPELTPLILDTLKQLGLKATFFVVGSMVQKSPALLRRIVAEGHALANHTWDHARLDRQSDAAVLNEVLRCQEAVDRALGTPYPMPLVRPPYGAMNARVAGVLRRAGYTLVGWDIDSLDWKSRRKAPIIARVLRQLRPRGGLLLMHDHVKELPELLPELVADLRARGYTILDDQTRLIARGLPPMFGRPAPYRRHPLAYLGNHPHS